MSQSKQEVSRRTFLGNTTLFLGAAVGMGALYSAFGKVAGAVESRELVDGGNCTANGTLVSIEVAHTPNHTLTIPIEDVVAGVEQTYTLEDNGSGHTHEVTFTAKDFASLQQNQRSTETSTFNFEHSHSVTVSCT